MPWKHTGAAKVQLHSFLTWALDGGEWSTARPGHSTQGKNPSTLWIGGPQSQSQHFGEGNNLLPLHRGKPKYTEKNLSQCHFIRHKSHMTAPGLKLRFYGDSPATNCLSHGTTWYSIKKATKQLNNNILMYYCNITWEHTLTWQQIWLSYSLTTGWSFQWLLPLFAWPQYSTHIQPWFGTPTYIALPLTQP